ncbi:MAG: hypothetical protein QM820_56535 [Minicystis sp.]
MARPRGPYGLLQIVSLVVAVLLGLAIVSLKLGGPRAPVAFQPALAQPKQTPTALPLKVVPKPAASAAPSAAPSAAASAAPSAAPSASPSASPSAAPSAAPAAGKADDKGKGGDDKKEKKPAGLDYASVQTEADFDKDMSDEQKSAIGTGKVPIHREGPFKSPFAHPRFGGPARVKVGTVISHVRDYNIQTGMFEAEFFLSLTAVDKDMPDVNLVFTNGKEVDQQTIVDTPTFKLLRVRGGFGGPVDLRTYPFDTQILPIEVEDTLAGVDQIIFEPDANRTSLDEGFQVPGWGVAHIAAKAFKHRYPPRFDRDDLQISRYKVEVGLDRFGVSAALSVFVPAYIIVIIALTGMWVPAEELEVRSNTGAPMLAAAVLFHYALLSTLPATGYLTRADKVMMGTYVALLLNMGSTWTFLIVHEEHIPKLFRFWRWSVPSASVAIMAIASVL